jgi:hypothetical protein
VWPWTVMIEVKRNQARSASRRARLTARGACLLQPGRRTDVGG